MISIRTDMVTLRALSIVDQITRTTPQTMRKIGTGDRLIQASEDAAGTGVAATLRANRFSLRMAMANSENGLSLISIAEGGMSEISNNLKRMRELAVASASDTLGNDERAYLDDEFVARAEDITRIAAASEWNGVSLLDTVGQTYEVQVGIDGTSNSRIVIQLDDLRANAAGMGVDAASTNVLTAADARIAIGDVDDALTFVNGLRSGLGATQNRIMSGYRLADGLRLNAAEAESRIRDIDVMFETAEMTRQRMTLDQGIALLAQARQMKSTAIQLIT